MAKQLRQADSQATIAFLEALFDPDDNVCFKSDPYTRSEAPAQFVCINPLREPAGKVSLDNIASYQALLIEFDKGTLKAQAIKYEQRLGLPYTTKTYSGGKSLHYVIRLTEPCSLQQFQLLNSVLHSYVATADTSCQNPNRLSRTAGVVRSNTGKQQTLLSVRPRVEYRELMDLIAYRAPIAYAKACNAYKDKQLRLIERATCPPTAKASEAPLLPWVQYMLDTGSYDGTSRHAALVRVGYSLDRIESVLYALQDKFAIPRNDVPGILKFVCR
jgi:hypothetical protein